MNRTLESTWETEFTSLLEAVKGHRPTLPVSFWAGVRDHAKEGRELLGRINDAMGAVLGVEDHRRMVLQLSDILLATALEVKFYECKLAQYGV